MVGLEVQINKEEMSVSDNPNFKKPTDDSKRLNSYATLTEVVQIARATAEDSVTDYHRNNAMPVRTALSLQVEMLKSLLVSKGIVTEDELKQTYNEEVVRFKEALQEENPTSKVKVAFDYSDAENQRDSVHSPVTVSLNTSADIEVSREDL